MFHEQKFDKFSNSWMYRTTPSGEWLFMDYEMLAWAYYNLKESVSNQTVDVAA